ncbi:MAG TPA: radical SAM/SPASM domain-containing protein [Candidatus Wunengus sp. YC65]|uniref:radical SAM/SPASM domain-containing protein n=1 Tax=Candidatus Wunengus sp. YC65 TaxID=3367701 RepID=UPI004024E350
MLLKLKNHFKGITPPFIKNGVKKIAMPFFVMKRIREWKGIPDVVLIENTNHCNAKCIMCPHSKMKRNKGTMSLELYKHIIDACIVLGIQRIQITGVGETLLDPLLFERIRYAKKAGIQEVNIFSNASLLTPQKQEMLLTSGVDLVFLSVDGFDPKSYEDIRRGLSFEDVKGNVLSLLRKKEAGGNKKPFIVIGGLRVKNNMSAYLKSDFYKEVSKLSDSVWIGEEENMHDWSGNVGEIRFSRAPWYNQPCRRLWNTLSILWDGKVSLCCIDYEGTVNLGNIEKQSILEIWNSREIKELRNCHLNANFEKIDLCKNCFERPSWIPKRIERILDGF